MRKQDYETLARIIAAELRDVRACGIAGESAEASLVHVAAEFAARASVDRAAFLKACGID